MGKTREVKKRKREERSESVFLALDSRAYLFFSWVQNYKYSKHVICDKSP